MFGKLLLVFILIPLMEMLILIKMGEALGFWAAVVLVFVTGFLGALAARIEGVRAWMNIQNELQAGRIPGEKMIDGVLIFAAGLLLITPGLLTDIAGFLLLIPGSRIVFKRWLRKKFDDWFRAQRGPGGSSDFRFFIH